MQRAQLFNRHEPNIFDFNPAPERAPLPPRVPFGRKVKKEPPPFWHPNVKR